MESQKLPSARNCNHRSHIFTFAAFGNSEPSGTGKACSEMGYGALFVIGLITSVHCIAMCGGINLSQTLSSEKNGSMFRNSLQYNIGRVISYSMIGGILAGWE